MGFQQDNGHKTPMKLSLFSLPTETSEPEDMLTPPPQTLASVPFGWEEAPGKPRCHMGGTTGLPPKPKPKAAKSLDLPPRLANITKTPSPTAVLEGPYNTCRKLPRAMSFSFSRGPFRSFRNGEKRQVADGEKIIGKCEEGFSSWRWVSFQEDSCEWRGVSDFSYSVGGGSRSEKEGGFSNGKITRFRTRGSFFGSSKSRTLTNIYESVKQAVRWRRKQ